MTSKNKLKYLFILGVLIAAGFALADSLGFFNPKPYTAVNHGSHNHYVPDNLDPGVGINRFPMEEPAPGEMITPTGQIVKKTEWKQPQKTASEGPENQHPAGDNIRTIAIIGTDQMKFVAKEEGDRIGTGSAIKTFNGKSYLMLNQIQVKPGEQLRIRLRTLSQLKPEMMAHNWVLLDQGVNAQAFVNAANRENDYIPPAREKDIIANTGLAASGETVEITFSTPEEPGRYEYVCSFMAHFAAGMRGQLIVQS
ncbi:plastocyanin/azurin family copper-binding protein [Aliifodinibius sp. S!AR15-10]|uniref:plastocyanin/azurin family copper-binding protein n=1 Tax=Aliifodinibius sp. S!AR15-10 TaxID=2950437 RepID=UPI00285EA8D9|nr:plastocyanin/azurin family copper-binding protein [Aliifodinibius sp. S!AR15-10]MDR8390478.1 plastocyanin/azurin family copper-binding protein [Aliifodinibius sp. S!AR15-10]